MPDKQKEKILTMLRNTKIPFNHISKATGLSASTLKNYVDGKTKPTKANITILDIYFHQFSEKNSQTQGNVVVGNDNNGHIDNRQYYSDSPDVLRAQIDILEERIREKDAQLREKDAQISKLLDILAKYSDVKNTVKS